MRNQRWLILVCIMQTFAMILVAPDSTEGWHTTGQLVMLAVWGICMTALMNLGHDNGRDKQ